MTGDLDARDQWLILVAFALLHLTLTLVVALSAPFPTGVDELQHLSFVAHMERFPSLVPDYGSMFTLAPEGAIQFTDERNYLQHPSFYYAILSWIGDFSAPLTDVITRLRIANVALSNLAVVILLISASDLLREKEAFWTFSAAIVLVPWLAPVGGSINNDNLALLGGALVFAGLSSLATKRATFDVALLVGGGFALGALSKLSAGLGLGLWIVFSHVALWRSQENRQINQPYLVTLLVLALIGVSPYLANLTAFGSPLYFGDHVFTSSGGPIISSFADYALKNLGLFLDSWVVFHPNLFQRMALVLLFGACLWALWKSRSLVRSHLFLVAVSGVAALLLTLSINLGYAYSTHLETGHGHGISARYYFPVWSAVAMGLAIGVGTITSVNGRRLGFLGVFLLMCAGFAIPMLT